jgi:pseudouridine-5'-phosphate glycosidase
VLGATTVSAAIWAANRAGIKVCATGGIGGVHPGKRADVSADLLELARTPVLLVCSGMKSIVDPVATAEKLEELGVLLVGYGVSELPFFLVRESSVKLEHRVENPTQTAALVRSLTGLGRESAVLLCNPVPKAHAMDPDEVSIAVEACRGRAIAQRISGKALTPFLLACLAERTQGRSLEANLALLDENARVAAAVAVAAAGG